MDVFQTALGESTHRGAETSGPAHFHPVQLIIRGGLTAYINITTPPSDKDTDAGLIFLIFSNMQTRTS